VGATLRQLSADYAALGQQGSGNLGTLENFAHNVTSDLLGIAAGAVSPTSYKEGVAHIQERASDVMARELADGGNGFTAGAQGLSTIVGDFTGYNGVMESAFGVDRATLESLGGVDRIQRGGFGVFQLGRRPVNSNESSSYQQQWQTVSLAVSVPIKVWRRGLFVRPKA
jgi:hypothetical protein